jgi:hypothetical protein
MRAAAAARAAAADLPDAPHPLTKDAGEAVAMSLSERAEFVNGYTRVLISTWSDEEFARRLDSDPAPRYVSADFS